MVFKCIVTEDLEKTGKFGKMSRSVDEREHSIEMHLPYIYHILQRYVFNKKCHTLDIDHNYFIL
jgi:predicted class III extradiol MEMO1 family dioxygenase